MLKLHNNYRIRREWCSSPFTSLPEVEIGWGWTIFREREHASLLYLASAYWADKKFLFIWTIKCHLSMNIWLTNSKSLKILFVRVTNIWCFSRQVILYFIRLLVANITVEVTLLLFTYFKRKSSLLLPRKWCH